MPPMLRKGKMETNKLYSIAENSGISVSFLAIPLCKGMALETENGYHIALDSSAELTSSEEKVILAHELGHCISGGLYTPDCDSIIRLRYEKRAELWAIENLVPLSELRAAIKEGDEAVSCLAERFGVTEDFMQRVIKYYCEAKSA